MASQLILHPDYQSLSSQIASLPTSFDQGGTLLYAGRNVIKRFVWPDDNGAERVVVVKRYARMRWLQRLCYSTFFASKARRAYQYAFRLLQLGILTPAPIACLEVSRHGLLERCYLATAECDWPDCTFLRNNPEAVASPSGQSLIQALSAFIVQLHERGILHGDLNLSNILYQQQSDGRWKFAVIDINRTRFAEHPSQRQCLANLVRLTHDRPLLRQLVKGYATLRGWSTQACADDVIARLTTFERRRELRHAIFRRKKSH